MAKFQVRIVVQVINAGKMHPNTLVAQLMRELKKIGKRKKWRVRVASAWKIREGVKKSA